ncbi:MAG TPA: Uma2 family endonuclease [Thermoanaerobaculia bacterium]|nr:Uma2 family endonuclease [Thermoanaerobaculia bacterium]
MEGSGMARTMAQGGRKLTHDDYLRFPDDGQRHELVDGEHFVTPSPLRRHQRVVENLFLLVAPFVRQRQLGDLALAPLDVILSETDVVEPDLLFTCSERLHIVQDWVRGAPDLVVEVLSPSSRRLDEVLKLERYERFGVAEYWLVDPEAGTVKVYRREGDRFAKPSLLGLREGERLSTPLLPGLEVALTAVFEGVLP